MDELHTQSCGAYELLLTGNPLPLAPLVELEDPSDSVEMGVEGVESGVIVRLRACELTGTLEAVLKYDGAPIKTLSFFPAQRIGDLPSGPSASTGGPSSGAVAAAVIVILILGLAGGFGFYLLRRRQLAVKGGAVEDAETGEAAADAGEKANAQPEEVKGEDEESMKVTEVTEDEKPEVVVEKEAIVEAEAEEALKAKLSVLEDVEGVKMIDDSINEGKDDLTSDPKADENVDV